MATKKPTKRRTRGRPPVGPGAYVHFRPVDHAWLRAQARGTITVSAIVRGIVEDARRRWPGGVPLNAVDRS